MWSPSLAKRQRPTINWLWVHQGCRVLQTISLYLQDGLLWAGQKLNLVRTLSLKTTHCEFITFINTLRACVPLLGHYQISGIHIPRKSLLDQLANYKPRCNQVVLLTLIGWSRDVNARYLHVEHVTLILLCDMTRLNGTIEDLYMIYTPYSLYCDVVYGIPESINSTNIY